ncbi:hypothetical protein AB0F92_32715 [Kitasatospora aureofaciens]|uniref:hypothetical protein n=1 Tax=Kitasatospora aureofaciens TaxID=1894 RepID=UPI0033D08505
MQQLGRARRPDPARPILDVGGLDVGGLDGSGLLLGGAVVVDADDRALLLSMMHRGVDGCIAWPYDPGVWSTTVYLHNRCHTTRLAKIAWKWSGLKVSEIKPAGDAKAHPVSSAPQGR